MDFLTLGVRFLQESIMKKWYVLLFLLPAVALIAIGSACAEGAKAFRDTLVIAATAIPVTLDPELGGSLESWEAPMNWGEALTDWHIKTNPNGTREVDTTKPPVCLVCESFSLSPDGMKWTFKLKREVKSFFGNELTSEDVKWSFERVPALQGVGTFIMKISGVDLKNPVTIIDKYTFEVNLMEPNPLLARALALPIPSSAVIHDTNEVKKHTTASDPWAKEWLATHTAGFGPFHVQSITPGQEVIWLANPHYHTNPPRIKKVIYKQVPDPATRAALLQRGEVDIATELTPRLREQLKNKPGVVIDSVAGNEAVIFGLNNNFPPLDNVKVRQAIAYATPVDDIIKTVFLNQPGVRIAPGYAPDYYPGALDRWPYQHHVEKAKSLLQEAGVRPFSFKLAFNSARPTHEEIAILIKSAFKDLGIEVVLDKLSPAKYQEQYFTRKADAVLVQDSAWLPDGPYAIGLYFHSTRGIADWINYHNPRVNELLDKGSSSLDFAERAQLAKEAHEIVVNEAPWGFYLHTGYHITRRENVKGFVWRTHNLLQFSYFFKD
jgi:peptide/nickel transport system substrate-binding protein